MRLIIERIDGHLYLYRESERHFRKVERLRHTPMIELAELDEDCNVPSDFHVVVDIARKQRLR